MSAIKTLLLDIEAAPTIGYLWSLRSDYIPAEHIVEPGYTLCWSAKWHGKPGIMFDSIHRSGARRFTRAIHNLLGEADAVISYNGRRYDLPTLQKDFLLQRFSPPAPYSQIDLYQTAKKFNFISRKLNFICKQLDIGEKMKHRGMDLWTGCMHGDEKSWKEMERYNKKDVTLLEQLYDILLPWVQGHPNASLYSDTDKPTCPNCGATNLQRRGVARTAVCIYARFQCKGCGAWSRGRSNQVPKELKDSVLARATG